MANLGLSNASASGLGEASERRRSSVTTGAAKRRKLEMALHVALFAAAFVFVAAIVCGVGS